MEVLDLITKMYVTTLYIPYYIAFIITYIFYHLILTTHSAVTCIGTV